MHAMGREAFRDTLFGVGSERVSPDDAELEILLQDARVIDFAVDDLDAAVVDNIIAYITMLKGVMEEFSLGTLSSEMEKYLGIKVIAAVPGTIKERKLVD